MTPSEACVSLVTCCEGLELEAYPDPASDLGRAVHAAGLKLTEYQQLPDWEKLDADPWTVGFGDTGPDVVPGLKITHDDAVRRLHKKLTYFAAEVDKCLDGVEVPQHQFDALVDFAYNEGAHSLRTSALLRLVREGKPTQAAAEFPKWNKAGGKVEPGLVKRRELERKLFLYGPAN